MKEKILEIYNDYKKDFVKYVKKIKRKIKLVSKKIRFYYSKVKENLLRSENRKKYLTTTGILIIANLLLINIYISFAYYNETASLSLLKAIVGDMYIEGNDYTLLVYQEDTDSTGNGNGKYHLTKNIPAIGYNYSGYKCQNNSTLVFNEETKLASVTMEQKEVCSVYFDVIGKMDLTVKIMLEETVNSNNYILGERIPAFGYKYSHYECQNNGVLEYDSELHKVKLSSSTQEHCSIYFNKDNTDITITLFVEEAYQTGEYIERLNIPSNVVYKLNESKSSCMNNNNERIDTTISYTDGYIDVAVSEIAYCNIYLDINEE